jgi:hypothetical protein
VDDEVEDLVDQAHRVQLPGQDRPLGRRGEVTPLVHQLGEAAGGREVRGTTLPVSENSASSKP